MSARRSLIFIGSSIPAVALVAGLALLFQLRFDVGDNYPPYSSFRTDPLGARALYDSLGALPGVSVERQAERLSRLPEGKGATLVCLGVELRGGSLQYSTRRLDADGSLSNFVSGGGRLVLTLVPLTEKSDFDSANWDDDATTKTAKADDAPTTVSWRRLFANRRDDSLTTTTRPFERPRPAPRFASGLFGDVDTSFSQLAYDQDKHWLPAEALGAGLELTEALRWRSAVFFAVVNETDGKDAPKKAEEDKWNTICARGALPVVIERRFGAGSVVLASDSYFASNEGLRDERQPALLAWMISPNTRVIFDETHLGVSQETGVMGLAKRYRLQGGLAVLLILAGLFIWKSAVGLVPPLDDAEAAGRRRLAEEGRDAWSGMVDLIERNIGPDRILPVCLEEWRRTAPSRASGAAGLGALDQELSAIVDFEQAQPLRKRNPAAAYRAMAETLSRRRRGRMPLSQSSSLKSNPGERVP